MRHRLTKGFTLIEVLTVMAIIGILTAAAVPVYATIQKNAVLGNTVDEIVSTLQLARTNAIAAKGATNWGVHFDPASHTYTLYSGSWSAPTTQQTYTVDDSMVLPSPSDEIVFTRLTGIATPTTLTVTGSNRQEQIIIPALGTITNQ